MSLSIIHDVAEPHTTNTTSLLPLAQSFQKCSRAGIKFERGVSIHGNSSKNTILRLADDASRTSINLSNASSQFRDFLTGFGEYRCNVALKFCNCALVLDFEYCYFIFSSDNALLHSLYNLPQIYKNYNLWQIIEHYFRRFNPSDNFHYITWRNPQKM